MVESQGTAQARGDNPDPRRRRHDNGPGAYRVAEPFGHGWG
jgi:hypothetical protein